jgi:hypothetical protein
MRAEKNSTHREPRLIQLFTEARAKYPTWSHASLLEHYVWKRRPKGTSVGECLKIAERFKVGK